MSNLNQSNNKIIWVFIKIPKFNKKGEKITTESYRDLVPRDFLERLLHEERERLSRASRPVDVLVMQGPLNGEEPPLVIRCKPVRPIRLPSIVGRLKMSKFFRWEVICCIRCLYLNILWTTALVFICHQIKIAEERRRSMAERLALTIQSINHSPVQFVSPDTSESFVSFRHDDLLYGRLRSDTFSRANAEEERHNHLLFGRLQSDTFSRVNAAQERHNHLLHGRLQSDTFSRANAMNNHLLFGRLQSDTFSRANAEEEHHNQAGPFISAFRTVSNRRDPRTQVIAMNIGCVHYGMLTIATGDNLIMCEDCCGEKIIKKKVFCEQACPICFVRFEIHAQVLVYQPCGHVFCLNCLDRYFQVNFRRPVIVCPVCRRS
jgi:hypothetical protein